MYANIRGMVMQSISTVSMRLAPTLGQKPTYSRSSSIELPPCSPPPLLAPLQVAGDFRRRIPAVVPAIHIDDGRCGKFLGRGVLQAAEVHAIDPAQTGHVADAERAHAAMPAKPMLVAHGVKQVFRQLRLAAEQAERLRLDERRPEPVPRTDRTVAPVGGCGEIDVRLEPDGSTVATARVALHHRPRPPSSRGS